MKSTLPQKAPTPIKIKSATLLNKQESPFYYISKALTSGCALARAAQSLSLFYSKGAFQ